MNRRSTPLPSFDLKDPPAIFTVWIVVVGLLGPFADLDPPGSEGRGGVRVVAADVDGAETTS